MKMKLEKMINGKRVVQMFKTDSISIYEEESDLCSPANEEHPCIQYVVNEETNDVIFKLQSDAPISVKGVL